MREYTVIAVVSVLITVVLERRLHVGLFRRAQYWIAMAIVLCFQVVVDGWLTKLSAPIVIYDPEHFLGIRVPWDIPIEDYLFGFSMVTSAIVLWEHGKRTRSVGMAECSGTAGGRFARTTDGDQMLENDQMIENERGTGSELDPRRGSSA